MFEIKTLTIRSIKIFIRDKTAVFFSFLSVIILLGLYLLFIKNAYKVDFLANVMTDGEQEFMINSMMMSGVLVINTLTLSLGNLGNIVTDFENNIIDAFVVTPIKRSKLIIAYFLSSFLITLVFTLIMWLLAVLIIGLTTGIFYESVVIIKAIGLLTLYTFISTAFMILLTTFIKSVNAFGAVAGVFGTIIGFTSGIYMPLSQFPTMIQKVSSFIPFTHMAIYLKQLLLERSFNIIESKVPTEAIETIKEAYTINELPVLGLHIDKIWILAVCVLLAVLSLLWATRRLSKRIKS